MSHTTNTSRNIHVLILSENHLIRAGLRLILGARPDTFVIAEVSTSASAVHTAAILRPDVILVDLDLSSVDVIQLMQDLQKSTEHSLILVLSGLRNKDLTHRALCSGAAGIVLKIQPPAVLIAAIEDLCGESRNERRSVRAVPAPKHDLDSTMPNSHEVENIHSLTTREREIVTLIGKGLRNKDIADRLCISEITVRHHLTSVYGKLNVSDRQKLLIFAHRHHLVELTLTA